MKFIRNQLIKTALTVKMNKMQTPTTSVFGNQITTLKSQYQQTVQICSKKPKVKPAQVAKPIKTIKEIKQTKAVKRTKTTKTKTVNSKIKTKKKNKPKSIVLQKKQPKRNQKPIVIQQMLLINRLVDWQIYQICQNKTPNMCAYFFMCHYIIYEAELQRFSIWLKWHEQQKKLHHQLDLTRNSIQTTSTVSIVPFLKRKKDLYTINDVTFPRFDSCVQPKHKRQQIFTKRFGLTETLSKQTDYSIQHMTCYDPSLINGILKKKIRFDNYKQRLFTNPKFYQTHPKEGAIFLNTWFCFSQKICLLNKSQNPLGLKSVKPLAKPKLSLDLIQMCPWFSFIQRQNKSLSWFSQTQQRLQNLRHATKINSTACHQNLVSLSAGMLLSSCLKSEQSQFLTKYVSIDLVRAQYDQPLGSIPLLGLDNPLNAVKYMATAKCKQPSNLVTIANLIRFDGWLQMIPYAKVCPNNHNKMGLEGQSMFDQHMILKRFFSQSKTPFYKATYNDGWFIWSIELQKKLQRLHLPSNPFCSKTPAFIAYLSAFYKQVIQTPFKLSQLTPILHGDLYASIFDFYAHNICLKKTSVFRLQSSQSSLVTMASKTKKPIARIKKRNKQLLPIIGKRLQRKLENVSFYYRLIFLKQVHLPYVKTRQHLFTQHIEHVVSDLRPIILKSNQIYWNPLSRYKPSLLVDRLCFKSKQKSQIQAVVPVNQTQKDQRHLPIIKQLSTPIEQEHQPCGFFYSLKLNLNSDLKNQNLQILFRQKAVFQVVQKATQLYTISPNPKKTSVFFSGLDKMPASYTPNGFQLTKAVKTDDPFYSASFSVWPTKIKLNNENPSTQLVTNTTSSAYKKKFDKDAKHGSKKSVKKDFVFQSSLFWVHFRWMCIREKQQMIKPFLPLKHHRTSRLIGLKGFNQTFHSLKHPFICSNNLRQAYVQIGLSNLIKVKPILTWVPKQKKARIGAEKTKSNTFEIGLNKITKTTLNKMTFNKQRSKVKSKSKHGKSIKQVISKKTSLNKRMRMQSIVCSKIHNISALIKNHGLIKHQVMLKPFVCFELPFDDKSGFDSQQQQGLIGFTKKRGMGDPVSKRLRLKNQIQYFQILKRWFPTSLGKKPLLSSSGLVVSTREGELIHVSNSVKVSSMPQSHNQPILTQYHKVKAYQTKSQINYETQPVTECIYLTNEDLQSYVLPNFSSKTQWGSIGQYVPVGTAFFEQAGFSAPGQVLFLNKKKVVIRRAKSFLLTTGATLQLPYGQFIPKNSPLVKLSYKQVLADDIIQGIPKIDRLFEARGIQPGITLTKLLKQQFKTFSTLYLNQADPDFSASATKITMEFIQHYTLDAIQNVYQSQGVTISDKHLEIIIKQMTSKVLITDPKNSGFLKGDLVDFQWINQANVFTKPEHRIQYEPIVLGITQSSLQTDGFISAASFQETINVLTKAAYFRTTDFLAGLKENVILGHLIPVGTGMRF
jgi:hypothetical protein